MTVSMPDHQSTTGRFSDGNSAYLARQRRLAERLAELVAQYDATVGELRTIAVHLDDAERARSRLDRTRARNAASRALKQIPRKQPKRPRNAAEWFDMAERDD